MDLRLGKLRPSVCVDAVYEGVPIESSVKSVAELGFSAFEFWCWWEKDLPQLIDLSQMHGMTIASCCTKFISLVEPGLRSEYLRGLEESISAARQLNCKTLISQVGDFVQGVDRIEQRKSLVAGLKESAKLLSGSGVTLVVEPLNDQVDHPGYFLVRSDEAFEIIEEVNSPDVKIVFDIYHQQISEGNLISNILAHVEQISHFHAAGNPGRHELSLGEINYPEIFKAIAESGYDGFVGLEYWPKAEANYGLQEVAEWFSVN